MRGGQSRSLRVLGIACGAIAMLASVWPGAGASASDRPGTPNRETAYECRKEGSPPYETRPSVCVMFTNTASERVRFDVEWTANGVKLSQEDFKGHIECARRVVPQFDPGGTQCVAGANLQGGGASTQVGGLIDWHDFVPDVLAGEAPVNDPAIAREAFMAKDLEFDTEYCFRFKARDVGNDMVSEEWSNWACAHTAPAPPKPSPPADLKLAFTAAYWNGGRDSPPVPAHIDFTWTADERYVAYLELTDHAAPEGVEPRNPLAAPSPSDRGVNELSDGDRGLSDRLAPSGRAAVVYFEPNELDALPQRTFRVCAHNVAGVSCSAWASIPEWHGPIERPNLDATAMTHPNAGEHEANRPVPTTIPQDTGQVGRRGGFGTELATSTGAGRSTACLSGFVWRDARDGDVVCVTPGARGRVAQENAEASGHVDPHGAYGSNSCAAGYVWREAYDGDVVCVTPEARALARQENADDAGRHADKDDVFRAPR